MSILPRAALLASLGVLLALPFRATSAQQAGRQEFTTIFYNNGGLRLQAYLYQPESDGLFPLVIYNHGSRKGHERESVPFRYVGDLLMRDGFAVLVPERRGYGQSDGRTFYEDVGTDVDRRFVGRLEEETGDVLAALEYVKTLPRVDQHRIGVMGWSLGGIVSMFASSRSDRFGAVVDQAGGALTWPVSKALQRALVDAVVQVKVPVLFMDAKNDRTTDAVTTLAKILAKNQIPNKLILYEAFQPAQNPDNIAPGPDLFTAGLHDLAGRRAELSRTLPSEPGEIAES
jgi:dienelactone hydrolase